jgi:putative protein-disulfide isomerase
MEREAFLADWASEGAIERTQQDFALTQGSGVQGFPTLIAGSADGGSYSLITNGYQPLDGVVEILARWLEMQAAS